MGNGIENGDSSLREASHKRQFDVPKNGLCVIDGVQYRSIDGKLLRATEGNEFAKKMSAADDDYFDQVSPVASILKSPMVNVQEGTEKHTKQSPHKS